MNKKITMTTENKIRLGKCSRALIVTPSSESSMHVSGGVGKVR